ncbi:magnesium transporter [Mycena maculata]|uniref:Magnesium transporter n=1 Tax=Mycena maculata TaxID=230809 RepID=A0AAD7KIB4_9AGAR|nr:magnesium transporter [Mycena maculata]
MPRENSFSDSDGRSLTPDLEDEINPYPPASPTYASPTTFNPPDLHKIRTRESARSRVATTRTALPPLDHFRHVVRKVMALHRGTNIMARRARAAGAEPGIDVRSVSADSEFGWIQQECVVEVVDYSAVRSSFEHMSNQEFVELMNDPGASEREPWVKVRYINICGMSWDVIKAVSLKYGLHPLALDDVLRAHPRAKSKADYYTQHLFLRVLCHELGEPDEPHEDSNPMFTDLPRSESPTGLQGEDPEKVPPFLEMHAAVVEADKERRIKNTALRVLKSGERVDVKVLPMFIFLFRDGTVISIHSTPSLQMTEPITSRLRQFDSGLRTSADASLLVQSLLGLVSDKALEVIDAYQDKIKTFERKMMHRPDIDTVRDLHILSADLLLHRRTLEPIKTVVYGLRRYDVDRAAAIAEGDESEKVAGFMSHKTTIYLADVHDHMEYVLSQLDVIAGIGKNLVDYTFNLKAYETNEVMRRLMLVTVIFLPLSVLTGYCGMNFPAFFLVNHNHSDWLYWAIALPIMAIVVPLFTAPDIQRIVHYFRKRKLTEKVVKSFKST